MLFLDTHAVVWLHSRQLDRFDPPGLALLEEEILSISPIVLLELAYLKEIGRIAYSPAEIVGYLADRIELRTDEVSFLPVAQRSLQYTWTRDPFDRIITAQADFHEAGLLTRDRIIRDHYPLAVW